MSKEVKKTIELEYGYQDKETPDYFHRRVVFSRRPNGADFMRSVELTDGKNPEYLFELMTASISEFGKLPMTVPMTVLLALNWIDQEELEIAFLEFLGATSGDDSETIENGKVKLSFGIERGGVNYDVVEFGKILNGYDQIQIRKDADSIFEQNILTMGREVLRITASKDSHISDEGLTLEELKNLDWEDFVNLQQAVEKWRDSFRKRRGKLA